MTQTIIKSLQQDFPQLHIKDIDDIIKKEYLSYICLDGRIAAVAGLNFKKLHYRYASEWIIVDPQFFSSDLVNKIHKKLHTEWVIPTYCEGVEICFDSNNLQLEEVVKILNFTKQADCLTFSIDTRTDCELSDSSHYAIMPIKQSKVTTDKIKSFFIEQYIKEHFWSKPDNSTKAWEESFDSSYSENLSFVALSNNEIVGLSLFHKGQISDISGIFTNHKYLSDEDLALKNDILKRQSNNAYKSQITNFELEVDCIDSKRALDSLLGLNTKKLSTYKRFYKNY